MRVQRVHLVLHRRASLPHAWRRRDQMPLRNLGGGRCKLKSRFGSDDVAHKLQRGAGRRALSCELSRRHNGAACASRRCPGCAINRVRTIDVPLTGDRAFVSWLSAEKPFTGDFDPGREARLGWRSRSRWRRMALWGSNGSRPAGGRVFLKAQAWIARRARTVGRHVQTANSRRLPSQSGRCEVGPALPCHVEENIRDLQAWTTRRRPAPRSTVHVDKESSAEGSRPGSPSYGTGKDWGGQFACITSREPERSKSRQNRPA